MQFSGQARRTAFSIWMRTGRWPRAQAARSVEVKFNPWHDPKDGRFTFAGAGQYFGPGSAQSANRREQDVPPYGADPNLPPISSREELQAWAAKERAKYSNYPNRRAHFKRIGEYVRESERKLAEMSRNKPGEVTRDNLGTPRDTLEDLPRNKPEMTGSFLGGLGKGLYNVGKGAVTGLYATVTDPVGSVYNLGLGVANGIDIALAAEDTPAYVHLNRAAHSIANASPEDWGYGLGTIGGNVALAFAPGAIATRISAASRLGEIGNLAASLERTAIRTNFDFYEVLSEQSIRGTTRGTHRASANAKLYRDLQSHPDLARMFDTELGADVLGHMSSGKGLLNPPGTVWHHPAHSPNVVQLLRTLEHTNPLTQPTLHPKGIGGFGAHYGN